MPRCPSSRSITYRLRMADTSAAGKSAKLQPWWDVFRTPSEPSLFRTLQCYARIARGVAVTLRVRTDASFRVIGFGLRSGSRLIPLTAYPVSAHEDRPQPGTPGRAAGR